MDVFVVCVCACAYVCVMGIEGRCLQTIVCICSVCVHACVHACMRVCEFYKCIHL